MLAKSKLNSAGSLGSKKAPNEFWPAAEELDGASDGIVLAPVVIANVGDMGVCVEAKAVGLIICGDILFWF